MTSTRRTPRQLSRDHYYSRAAARGLARLNFLGTEPARQLAARLALLSRQDSGADGATLLQRLAEEQGMVVVDDPAVIRMVMSAQAGNVASRELAAGLTDEPLVEVPVDPIPVRAAASTLSMKAYSMSRDGVVRLADDNEWAPEPNTKNSLLIEILLCGVILALSLTLAFAIHKWRA